MAMTTTQHAAPARTETDLTERWRRDWLLGSRWFIGALLVSSFALAIAGMVAIWLYETTAGPPTEPARVWPVASPLIANATGQTLILFAHPKCPCTRASLATLSEIAAQHRANVTTQVVFFRPALADDSWRDSDLCRTAANDPNLSVVFDEEATEARRFGVITSGHALLYGRDGTLQFSGGITSARGRAGDSAGRAALMQTLAGKATEADQTPVFGCPLLTPETNALPEEAVCPLP